MKRYLIILQGTVQGVGCRMFVYQHALKYKLTGYVRNLSNGNVEIQVQGEEFNLKQFIQEILPGDRFITIENYSVKDIEINQKETKFKYLYD